MCLLWLITCCVLSLQLTSSADRASSSVAQESAPTRPTSVMETTTARTTPTRPIAVHTHTPAVFVRLRFNTPHPPNLLFLFVLDQTFMCACQVSLNVPTPVAASLASSVAMDRTTVERERTRKTAVSTVVLLVQCVCLFISTSTLVVRHL